jgi:hypothetical protein
VDGALEQEPDPERDAAAWAALVVANTRANSGESTCLDLERAIDYEHDDLIAISWAHSKDDMDFADSARRWAGELLRCRKAHWLEEQESKKPQLMQAIQQPQHLPQHQQRAHQEQNDWQPTNYQQQQEQPVQQRQQQQQFGTPALHISKKKRGRGVQRRRSGSARTRTMHNNN